MPPPEIGVPSVQAATPPCRSFDQSLLVKPATYRRHPTPCATLLRVSPEASPTSAPDLAYARPLARAGTLINCDGATDPAVPTPLSVRTFRESADLEKVVGIAPPCDADLAFVTVWVGLGCVVLGLYRLVVVSTLGDRVGGRGSEEGQTVTIATSATPSASSPASAASHSGLRAAVGRLTPR